MSSTNAMPAKVNLMGLTKTQMEQFFLDIGEKSFRAQQVLKWIHHSGVTSIDDMTNLGKALREKLADLAEVIGTSPATLEGI